MSFNGYRPHHRNEMLLIRHGVLKREEYLLFEYCIDQMGFDKRNDKYGVVEVDLRDVSLLLGYSDKKPFNSVRSLLRTLVKVGCLSPVKDKRKLFAVYNPDRYVASTKLWGGRASEFQDEELDVPFEKIVQNIAPNVQTKEQIVQNSELKVQPFEQNGLDNLEHDVSRSLSTSKVDSNVSLSEEEGLTEEPTFGRKRTYQDYVQIYEKGGYQGLTPEDMQWLDEHISAEGKVVL